MSVTKPRQSRGIILTPDDIGVEGIEGEIKVAATAKKLQVYLDGALRNIVSETQAQTLTSKTIVVASNIITTAASGNLAATELNAALSELQSSIDSSDSGLATHIANPTDAHDASAISSIPAGNLSATNAQAALNELQSDIDTRATSSALSAHESSTAAHGATGAVVGTTNTQTLTNKTLTAPVVNSPTGIVKADVGLSAVDNTSDATKNAAAATLTNKIITGADFRTPIRSDVKQDTKNNLITYALTATNAQLVFATDEKLMYQVVDSALVSVGSAAGGGGTGVDSLFTQTFETATLSNFTQTGLSLSSVSPLDGTISALMTHQPALPQSFKQIVPVYEKFRGLAMSLGLNVKSNATAGNVTITIYDETNTATILASTQLTLSSLTGGIKNTVSFVIPATCLSMSYTVTALQEVSSPVTRVDDIICQIAASSLLSTSVIVPKVTAWASYVPTYTGFGTVTDALQWRRNGESVEIRGKFTSGASSAVEARVSLPNGYTSAGTSLIPSLQMIGKAASNTSSATYFNASVLIEPSVIYMTFGIQRSTSNEITKVNGSALSTTGDLISFFASVPVSGLSATEAVTIPLTQSGIIQDADSMIRFTTGNGYGSVSTSLRRFLTLISSRGTDITYIDSPTAGASFTVQTAGIYNISFSDSTTGQADGAIQIYVNGSIYARGRIGAEAGEYSDCISASPYLNVGDVITLANGALPVYNNETDLVITKQGSLKQVTVNTNSKITIPTSELRFEGSSSRGTTATAIVKFDTQAKIRGDAFTVTNTAADGTVITMTKAGRLNVSSSISLALGNLLTLSKNQTTLTATPTSSQILAAGSTDTNSTVTGVSWAGDVIVGDAIRVSTSIVPSSHVVNQLNLSFQEQSIQVSVSNTLPQFSESDTSLRLSGANGFGTTATTTRRFASTIQNIGTDITYTDSPTLGGQFVAKSSGIYNVSYTEQSTANATDMYAYIVLNGTTVSSGNQVYNTASTAIKMANASWQGYLTSGDIISGSVGIAANANGNAVLFTMSKVGKPNVTGVNITPFINVPQPDKQGGLLLGGAFAGGATITGTMGTNVGSSIFSYNSTTGIYTVLKTCTLNLSGTAIASSTSAVQIIISRNSTMIAAGNSSVQGGGFGGSTSYSGVALAGDVFYLAIQGPGTTSSVYISISATANADQILTAPETFSTDTAALAYSSTYTLASLTDAPVGSYITYTYAGGGNIRTQTAARPTQTDADMNANGVLIYSRAYNAASTAAQPAAIAIQIGKGLKGKSLDLYKSAGKVTAGNLDSMYDGAARYGAQCKDYNEVTGVILFDAALNSAAITSTNFLFTDTTLQTSGYLVINASKNPALTGLGISTVAASGRSSSGQVITASTSTTITYDASKRIDTHGALNAATGIFTAPVSGHYQVSAGLTLTAAAFSAVNNIFTAQLFKNGVASSVLGYLFAETTALTGRAVRGSDIVFLAKGDTLALTGFQNSAASKTLTAGVEENYFSITKVSI